MIIDFSAISSGQAYYHMLQTVVPRPIAWVLSENQTGSYNLAPFSYFNAVCSSPPLLMISVGKKPNGSFKDTRINIEHRKKFVVHIAHRAMLGALNQSSETLPADVSELDNLDLELDDFDGFKLPRIKSCRVAFACECHDIIELGEVPQSIIFGKIIQAWVDDAIASADDKGRIKIHTDRLDPIARLGANEYMLAGDITALSRPK